MKKKKKVSPTHGGARAGAGRKPIGVTVEISVRLTQEQATTLSDWARVDGVARSQVIRDIITWGIGIGKLRRSREK